MTCRQCGKEAELENSLCADCQRLEALPDALAGRKELGGVPFSDMKDVDEDKRVALIVWALKQKPGMVLSLLVDAGAEYAGKGDRYIARIQELLPGVKLVARGRGPVKDCEFIQLTLPQ